ncbi:MAG: hypothetical protein JWQ26_1803 [Modestobacter sp.]|nr:hypothetical protein [Modestobacter sp.]
MLVVLLVLLLGGAVVADRVGVGIAEDQVAQQIAERGGLAGTPDVDITGFPFLTQAVSGRYTDVRVSLTADQLGQPAGTRAQVSLRGVRIPLSDVLSGSVQEVPVDRIDGTATLSYALLAQQLGGDTTVAPADGGLRITRTVSLLGYDFPVTGAGAVVLDGRDVVVDVQQAAAAGVDVPGFVLDRAADLLDFRYPVPALPFGLRLTSIDPGRGGVRVGVEARDTVLRG